MELALRAGTRRTRHHPANEDRVLLAGEVLEATDEPRRARLSPPVAVAVLDGMGGHPAGDVASDLAARTLAGAPVPTDEQAAAALLQRTHEILVEAGGRDASRRGMGTTVALAAVGDDAGTTLVATVGDSPVLRARGGELVAVTESDRSLGSSITQSLGGGFGLGGIRPHLARFQLAPGDRLLLATDGLTDVLDPAGIARVLAGAPEEPVAALLAAVDEAGTPDDVSVVLLDVV